jgi:hypothetical protein
VAHHPKHDTGYSRWRARGRATARQAACNDTKGIEGWYPAASNEASYSSDCWSLTARSSPWVARPSTIRRQRAVPEGCIYSDTASDPGLSSIWFRSRSGPRTLRSVYRPPLRPVWAGRTLSTLRSILRSPLLGSEGRFIKGSPSGWGDGCRTVLPSSHSQTCCSGM